MIRRTILAAVTAAALLFGSVTVAPTVQAATADGAPWNTTVTCASGRFLRQWIGTDAYGHPATWVSWQIVSCSPPAPADRYAVVYYVQKSDGLHGRVNLSRGRAYPPRGPVQPTLQGQVDHTVEQTEGPLVGICLAWRVGGLVHCLQPARPDGSGPPSTPLPPIAELATVPVTVYPDLGSDPNCATCV